jgi:hypothetical protein
MKIEQAEHQSKLGDIKSVLLVLSVILTVIQRKTAKTFLAASVFLELLKTFGDIDPDVCEIRDNCVFKQTFRILNYKI